MPIAAGIAQSSTRIRQDGLSAQNGHDILYKRALLLDRPMPSGVFSTSPEDRLFLLPQTNAFPITWYGALFLDSKSFDMPLKICFERLCFAFKKGITWVSYDLPTEPRKQLLAQKQIEYM
jgi:hypothetical protein